MILNIIMFKNKRINAFTNPNFTDIEPKKAAIQLARSLQLNEDPKIKETYQNLDMYVCGQFDDETGVITQTEPLKLLDCTEVLKDVRQEKDTSVSTD